MTALATTTTTTLRRVDDGLRFDEADLAAVAFLARYSGRTLDAYRHDLRMFFQWTDDHGVARLAATRGPTSSCTGGRWSSAAWRPPRSIGGCPRCVATTGSRTSTAASPPTPPSTSAAPRSTRRRGTAWTAPSSARSCSPPSGTTRSRRARRAARPQRPAGVAKRARTNIEDLAVQRGHRTLAHRRQGQQARGHPSRAPGSPHHRPRRRRTSRRARSCAAATGSASTGAPPTGGSVRSADGPGSAHVHPHMLRAGFIMAALDAGVPLRDVQIAARHADPRTTTIYDRRRENFDRHAAYVVVAFVVVRLTVPRPHFRDAGRARPD